MHPQFSNIGAFIKPVLGLAPLENSAGTRQGPNIDVSKYMSLTLAGFVGAASGTPSAQSVTYSLESSPDGTNWTDVTGSTATAIAADSTLAEVDVNLAELPESHYLVRVKEVTAFTGGTTPKIEGAAVVILGGSQTLPI